MNAVKAAIYTKLTGASALTDLLAGTTSVYDNKAPRGADMPYVIFGLQGGGDENITQVRYKSNLYSIKGVSESSAKEAGQIDAQIDALMHGTTLTIASWTNYSCVRETDVDYVETTPEGDNVWHVGAIYRIRLANA